MSKNISSSHDPATADEDIRPTPTISIYQDPAHIEGILQQSNWGLITESTVGENNADTQTSTRASNREAEVAVDVKIPVVGGVEGGGQMSRNRAASSEAVSGHQATRNFKYTSAYYLHHVREELRARELLKSVSSAADARQLSVGNFVEFRAAFRPDELISLMDVFNPDLVGALTRWLRKKHYLEQYLDSRASGAPEATTQNFAEQFQQRPDMDAAVAKAIVEAVRVDFRSDATREFYGALGDSDADLTAVVVCDTRNFLVEDADRILDGHFTVLGKVSTPPATDVPVLSRNKVLDRIQPETLDLIVEQLETMAAGTSAPIAGRQQALNQYLDMNFPSRLTGESFKVIPIAIYI